MAARMTEHLGDTQAIRRDAALGRALTTIRVDVIAGPDAGQSQTSSAESLSVGTAPGNTLQVTDRTVSRYHLELRREGEEIVLTDLGSTNGTRAGDVRLERARVKNGTTLALGMTRLRVSDGAETHVEMSVRNELKGLKGNTDVMRRLLALIEKSAKSDVPVLVTGESGTGKELIARALHAAGPRAEQPFVVVDCGSLSPTLIGSELFGHERGAFTGATDRHAGAFEQAGEGTVFLDEVGELPPTSQAALLGVLERGTFRRLGGRVELPMRARIVSATNRDLRSDVNRHTFRLDLYFRLAIVVLLAPPLRDRREDIPLLAEHFAKRAGHRGDLEALIPHDVLDRMRSYSWPGNVRELRNVIDAAVTLGADWMLDNVPELGKTGPLEPISDDLTTQNPPLGGGAGSPPPPPKEAATIEAYNEARAGVLAEFEKRYLKQLYQHTEGNVSKAARLANMDRSHLVDLLRKHGIHPSRRGESAQDA